MPCTQYSRAEASPTGQQYPWVTSDRIGPIKSPRRTALPAALARPLVRPLAPQQQPHPRQHRRRHRVGRRTALLAVGPHGLWAAQHEQRS
eukprot:316358-Prymnesium_polylepis.1